MLQTKKLPLRLLMLLPALLLLSACAHKSSAYVEPPAIPPLPSEARQPTIPSACLPSCSANLTTERESWLSTLIGPE